MARYNKGILGTISGTVGTVTGSSWKGINYLRSLPASKHRSSTADQLDHQLKFSTVINFVHVLLAVIELTFKKYAVKMSEYNAAFQYNYYNALTGKSPDYEIDYAKALVSRGDLPNAIAPAASVTGKEVFFTWTDNSGTGDAAATDNAVMVAYCPLMNECVFSTIGAQRSAGAGTLNTASLAGQTVETWLAFLSADGTMASDSFFTGELVIS